MKPVAKKNFHGDLVRGPLDSDTGKHHNLSAHIRILTSVSVLCGHAINATASNFQLYPRIRLLHFFPVRGYTTEPKMKMSALPASPTANPVKALLIILACSSGSVIFAVSSAKPVFNQILRDIIARHHIQVQVSLSTLQICTSSDCSGTGLKINDRDSAFSCSATKYTILLADLQLLDSLRHPIDCLSAFCTPQKLIYCFSEAVKYYIEGVSSQFVILSLSGS